MASIFRLGAGAAFLVALLVPVAASDSSTGSGLYGTVTKGPIMPVCSVDKPCDAPAQVTLVFTRTTPDGLVQSRETWRVRSSDLGKYRISLQPGFYLVRSTVKIGLTKLPKPHSVHVRAGHWDKINLFFDTGIR